MCTNSHLPFSFSIFYPWRVAWPLSCPPQADILVDLCCGPLLPRLWLRPDVPATAGHASMEPLLYVHCGAWAHVHCLREPLGLPGPRLWLQAPTMGLSCLVKHGGPTTLLSVGCRPLKPQWKEHYYCPIEVLSHSTEPGLTPALPYSVAAVALHLWSLGQS
jgi:hypothetical protein